MHPSNGHGNNVYDACRKRPSLSCPDLSSEELMGLRSRHATALEQLSESKQNGVSGGSEGNMQTCQSRDLRVRMFQQRSYTVPDQPTDSSGSGASSPKTTKVKKFFHGILRQHSLGSQFKAFSAKNSPVGSPTKEDSLQRTVSGPSLVERKSTINTLLASAFSGFADVSSDDEEGKSKSTKLRRIHVINSDGESSDLHPGQNGAQQTGNTDNTGSGDRPKLPRNTIRKGKNATSSDLYLLNDRCVACLDAARDRGNSCYPMPNNCVINRVPLPNHQALAQSQSTRTTINRTQLSIDKLEDGHFYAYVHLYNFPSGGEIVLRLDGYYVDIFWFDKVNLSSPSRSKPAPKKNNSLESDSSSLGYPGEQQLYAGSVQLPPFADLGNLKFVMATNDSVCLVAKVKGMIERNRKRPPLALASFSHCR